METYEMNNLRELVDEFVDELLITYKQLLIKDGKSATGNLIKSLKNTGTAVDGDKIQGNIEIADYWKYVENGRKPGKFPPPNKILNWVETKSLPRPESSLSERKSLSYLIGRKISKEGIKPGNQFSTALNLTWDKMGPKINEAVGMDLEKYIKNILL